MIQNTYQCTVYNYNMLNKPTNACSYKDELNFTGMWLELPAGVDSSDSSTACLEPLYYRVVLSLFSLLTHCVESGASEPGKDEDGKDNDSSGGSLTNAGKVLLQTILTVSTIKYMYINRNKGLAHYSYT